MKTRYWICLLAVVLVVCVGLCLVLLSSGETAQQVRIISEGEVLHLLPLNENTRLEIVSAQGTNVVEVKDGKVAVIEADCPDGYCKARGFCDSGTPIVCLPNRLILEFVEEQAVDGVAR